MHRMALTNRHYIPCGILWQWRADLLTSRAQFLKFYHSTVHGSTRNKCSLEQIGIAISNQYISVSCYLVCFRKLQLAHMLSGRRNQSQRNSNSIPRYVFVYLHESSGCHNRHVQEKGDLKYKKRQTFLFHKRTFLSNRKNNDVSHMHALQLCSAQRSGCSKFVYIRQNRCVQDTEHVVCQLKYLECFVTHIVCSTQSTERLKFVPPFPKTCFRKHQCATSSLMCIEKTHSYFEGPK